jgi:hypothetical protein
MQLNVYSLLQAVVKFSKNMLSLHNEANINIRQSLFSHQKDVCQYPQNKHLLSIAPLQCRWKHCFVLQLLQNPPLCSSTLLKYFKNNTF